MMGGLGLFHFAPVTSLLAAFVIATTSTAQVVAGGDSASQSGPVRAVQTVTDEFVRYELLRPQDGYFRILHDITVTTAEATAHIVELPGDAPFSVAELATGQTLQSQFLEAREMAGLALPTLSEGQRYLRITLPREVPANGGIRIRITREVTAASELAARGDSFSFSQLIAVRRNAVVLPAGYEVAEVNSPVLVSTEADGRIRISFDQNRIGDSTFELRGRKLPQ